MENFTDEIRNEFYEKEVLTIKDLYTKFVELSKSNIQQKSKKHKIRSVVNNLHKRGEIIRFDNGNYKKTDKILKFTEKIVKVNTKQKPNTVRKENYVNPKYDENFD
jgi:hypothetical protein